MASHFKTSRYSSFKHSNPSVLIQIIFHPKPTATNHFCEYPLPKSHPNLHQSCTNHYHSSVDSSLNSSNGRSTKLAQELKTLFSNRSIHKNEQELRNLGATLTAEAVEIVLNGFKNWRDSYDFFLWAGQQDEFKHTCYTYNSMASILSRANQKTQLKSLVKDVVNCKCSMTAGALGYLIRCLGSLGLVDEANFLFDRAKTLNCVPNSYTYNCLLEVLARSRRCDLVETRYGEMVGYGLEPDKFTLTPVLQAYCNSGKFEEALGVFGRMYDMGWVDEHILTILLVSFSKWGEVDKAWELLERMGDLKMSLNEKTHYVLIHGFAREKRVDKALILFNRMKELGFVRDLGLYSVVIQGLCDNKEYCKVLDLYLEMKVSGPSPDVAVFTKMISSFCGEGDLVNANMLLEDGQNLDVVHLVSLYNAVLEGLVNGGQVEKAYLLVRTMMASQNRATVSDSSAEISVINDIFMFEKAVCPNATSFNIVIDGLCKTQKLDTALELFNDMFRIGCCGNVLIYNNLIHELCNADRLEESYALLKRIKESEFNPTHFTYNSILGCLCRREDVSNALDLIKEMRILGHTPWIKHYTMLVKRLCEHGKVAEASDFLKDMAQAGFPPDVIAYSAAIDGLCRIGEVDNALKHFHDMSGDQHVPDVVAHNILIRGFCRAGRVLEAQEILDEMLERGLVPSVVTYNLMIDGWCKANKIDLALLCFSKMVAEARPPTVITYTTLIDGLCNAKRPDDSLVLWNEMTDKGCVPTRVSYIALVCGLCKCGRPDTGLNYFRKMEAKEFDPDAFVYVTLLSAFVLEQNPVLAFTILSEMVEKAKFPSPSDKHYPLLMDALSKLYVDPRTSSDLNELIEDGRIPMIRSVCDLGEDIKKC